MFAEGTHPKPDVLRVQQSYIYATPVQYKRAATLIRFSVTIEETHLLYCSVHHDETDPFSDSHLGSLQQR